MAYLNLTGNAGSRATTPDAAVLDISGDMDLIVDVHVDWTNVAAWDFITKWESTVAQQSFWLDNNNGSAQKRLRLIFYDSGGTQRLINSSWASTADDIPYGDERAQLRVFLDVDNGSGGSDAYFYHRASSGDSWTALGTNPRTIATTTGAIRTGTAIAAIGSRDGTNSMLDGKVYQAQIWSGDSTSGGTLAFDADFSDATTWTYS